MDPQRLAQLAIEHHRKGDAREAERLCLQIAASAPFDFTANYLLGVIRFGQGHHDDALPFFQKAAKANPHAPGPLIFLGLLLEARGRLPEALACFDRVLALDPNNVEALINRGNALCGMTRYQEALSTYEGALARKPDFELALYNRGNALLGLRRPAEALASFDAALARKPDHLDAWVNRGTSLRELGQFEAALASFDRALALQPGNLSALYNRGTALNDLKRFAEALSCFDRVLGLAPELVMALNNRATVLQKLGRFEEALADYDHALTLERESADLLSNRGNLLLQMKRGEEALASMDRALAVAPHFTAGWHNRGLALRELGRLTQALASHDRALNINPQFGDALSGRAAVLRDMGRLGEALESYDRALILAPQNLGLLMDRSWLLLKMNRPERAIADYDRVLAIDPTSIAALHDRGTVNWIKLGRFAEGQRDLEQVALIDPDYDYLKGDLLHLRMQAADWRDFDAQVAAIDAGVRAGRRVVRPFVYQAIASSPADLQAASVIYAQHRFPAMAGTAIAKAGRGRKIRLGYVSGEFRNHATALLAAELFERHDRSKFEIIAFDTGWNDGSAMRARLQAAFDKFVSLAHLSDSLAAEMVRAEEIDILVNLTGYFGREPMGIFAHRAAPIQVNYLGFPATLGAPYMDYILADAIVIPPDEQKFYTEKVVYLPYSYQVNDSKRLIADTTPSRTQCALPDKGFVFCNFNNIYKLTPSMFAVWMDILRQTPDSVLWLLESNQAFAENLRMAAGRHGVTPERLVFASQVLPPDFLARMQLADLFLDGLPYNAHTTASDALWAGLPLLTCKGATFPGRVATSLLHAMGLTELVTDNLRDYQALALKLALDADLLAAIRLKLTRSRAGCPLFDTDRFRKHVESAYIAMWDGFQRGIPAQGFTVKAAP